MTHLIKELLKYSVLLIFLKFPRSHCKPVLYGLIIFPAFLLGLSSITYAAPKHKFYYFNPDSLQSNLGNLKRNMDNFFSQTDSSVLFQPFAHLVDFEQTVKKNPPSYLLVPEWFMQKQRENFRIRPLLVPRRNGKQTYRKVLLISNHSNITLTTLKNRSLAMTSMGGDSEEILNTILFKEHHIDARDINIVYVPKDSDALFALALGQVEMAFVVKENIQEIAKINPRITQSTRALIESSEISMPILGYIEGTVSDEEIQEFIKIFKHNSDQRKIMEMLKIDDWQIFTK